MTGKDRNMHQNAEISPGKPVTPAAQPFAQSLADPTTKSGRAALNLIREPLIYGVYDRLSGSHHAIAWAVRDGIVAAEAEARALGVADAERRIREAVEELYPDDGTPRSVVSNQSRVHRRAVLAAIESATRRDDPNDRQ